MPTFDSVLVAISLAELFLTTTNHMPSTAKLILNQLPISNTSVHQLESALPTSLQSKDLSTPRVIETNDENSSPSNHSNNQILKTELRRKIYEKSYYNILQGNNLYSCFGDNRKKYYSFTIIYFVMPHIFRNEQNLLSRLSKNVSS